MFDTAKKVASIATGVVIGGLLLWGVFTLIKDHFVLKSTVNFLNAQIQAAQPKK